MFLFLIFMKKHVEINTLGNSQYPSANAWTVTERRDYRADLHFN